MANEGSAAAGRETDAILLGILAVLVDDRERTVGQLMPKTEVLLSDAGMPIPLIARAMNKQPDAVRMVVARARQKGGAARPAGSKSSGSRQD